MKRYLYIILGIIVLAAVAIGIISLFKKQSPATVVSGMLGSLPQAANQSFPSTTGSAGAGSSSSSSSSSNASTSTPTTNLVSHDPVIAYFVSQNDNVVILHSDGEIESMSGSQSILLGSSTIANILSAAFSSDGKMLLVSSGDAANPQWSVFNMSTGTWSPLPVNPVTAAWSPSGYQIAYFATVNGVSALETIDLGTKNAKPKFVTAFPGEDFQIVWKSPADILLEDLPSALFSGSIFDVNLKTGTISTVVISKVGLETQWNASGTMAVILAGTALARGGQLGIIDDAGTLMHQLTFLTLPTKCVFPPAAAPATASSTSSTDVFSSFGLICAIPRDASALNNNPLPDAYNERVILTSDDFYSIDLTSGNVTPLFVDQSQNFDASNIELSNDALYFINRYDQKLYSLTFPQQQ